MNRQLLVVRYLTRMAAAGLGACIALCGQRGTSDAPWVYLSGPSQAVPSTRSQQAVSVALSARERWPSGHTPYVRVKVVARRGPTFHFGVRVRPAWEHHHLGWWVRPPGALLPIPVAEPGAHTLKFIVEVYRARTPDEALGVRPTFADQQTLSIRIDGRLEDCLEAVGGDDYVRALRDRLHPRLVVFGDEVVLDVQRHRFRDPMWRAVAVAFEVELLRDGSVVERTTEYWLAGPQGDLAYPGGRFGGRVLQMIRRGMTNGWSLRIVGDARLALRVPEAKKYWDGIVQFDTVEVEVLDAGG